ncbi:transcriptional regulator [Winogradskyella sp. J14-2]|uniref:helix-turn-helix and ligand-binding sensor domain-containing protein n=1 Tax=Winogradskyella sp. J14-2 TaxID=1936080 RepID=UPI0009729846|nr:helix-turn-helix transcriptional regulator [Winogradskyella sp. J14-2]APY09411.1 transcriptional regulator [Winogradskyella sp. J14-2]
MKKIPLTLYFTFLFTLVCYCQFSPNIYNYSIAEYKASNQNWDLCRAKDGKVYVANNIGLLEYDGLDWKLFQLPNKTTVRSVLTHKNLIFTGSFEEFGYWYENDYGKLVYQSLSDLIKPQISANEEIWQIINYDEKIIFRSFSSIYIYDFKNVYRIQPSSAVISLNLVDGDLLLSTLNTGIYRLQDKSLIPFFYDEALKDTKIISIVKKEDQYLILTSLKGSFYLRSNKLQPTDYAFNEEIKQHQLNKFSKLENGDMVFGTIKDGVYIANSKGEIKFHISKENGLANNTILGQFLDQKDNLWLGLDNGIASIDLDNTSYFFNDISGKLGAVYDIVRHEGLLYIGTNTGLFFLDDNNNLNFIDGSQGQVWDLKIIDNNLFCGHNEGTFLVNKSEIKKISDFTGGWTIQKVPEHDNLYIQGTYAGLVKFQQKNGKWETKHMGKTTIPSRFLVFENPYTAWVAHAYKGVYKVNFNKSYDTITKVTNYGFRGLDSEYNTRVYNIRNDIVFKTNNGWQKYEPLLDSIVPFNLLNKKFGKHSYIISEQSMSPIVLKDKKGVIRFKYINNDSVETKINNKLIKKRYIVDYEHVSKIDDALYALNLDNGFMLIDETFKDSTSVFKPKIETIKINGDRIKLSSIKEDSTLKIKYNQSINLEISSSNSNNHFFEYSIPSLSKGWFKVDNRNLELNNINHGLYNILLRTIDDSGNTSEIKTLQLDVSPPWYKGTIGLLLYVLVLCALISLFYYLHHRKIQKEQRLMRVKYQREQHKLLREKTLENEKHIVQLKNESLQNELKIKSKQLANNAMALVKKNEVLQDIKKELAVNKEGFKDYYSYKKLIKKLNNSIERKDEWEVFEENFNQVHDEFFTKLKTRHSVLTPKDLKVCAYIKMNLANKEIAPLMNISVRGVETHRYRLKKKLDLENDISLTDYLLNIK